MYLHNLIDQCFSKIENIQQLMSFHDPKSELSQLNQFAFQRSIAVHPFTFAVLKRAERMFQASQGLFDCSIANTLVDWQLLPKHQTQSEPHPLPDFKIESENKRPYSQANVQLLANYHVKFTAPIMLDLGGIAKGFAVDIAIQHLRKSGIENAVVNAGGDLRVLGHHAETISLRSPQNPQQLLRLGELTNGAIASSATYFSKTKFEDHWVNALVNPKDRTALDSEHSFSVIAPTASLADALTKVIALSHNPQHPCLTLFSAQAFIL